MNGCAGGEAEEDSLDWAVSEGTAKVLPIAVCTMHAAARKQAWLPQRSEEASAALACLSRRHALGVEGKELGSSRQ